MCKNAHRAMFSKILRDDMKYGERRFTMVNYSEMTQEALVACQKDCVEFRRASSHGGIQMVIVYPNGYGASIIKHAGSYGGESDLWEVAVLVREPSGKMNICYDTPITYDVIGWLEESEVIDICQSIRAL